jgi:hypothetical protein
MTDYTVDSLSMERIEAIARDVLASCPKLPSGGIDILAALRLPTVKTIRGVRTLRLKLVADDLLPGKLAQVWVGDGRITATARTSLWNKAEDNDAEALKELRHEYGHVLLHSGAPTKGAVTLNRELGGNAVHKFIEADCSAENQADWIAACLAMPFNKFSPSMDVRDVVADWNVPKREAQWRLERVRSVSPKRLPDSLKRDIDWLRAGSQVTPQAQALWDRLPLAADRPPTVARIANGFLVEYSKYNQCAQTGWAVEANKIVPLMLKMQA